MLRMADDKRRSDSRLVRVAVLLAAAAIFAGLGAGLFAFGPWCMTPRYGRTVERYTNETWNHVKRRAVWGAVAGGVFGATLFGIAERRLYGRGR
jgi:hypothetical protein